ncbi:cysteine-rich motor neuron 1 protein isoform X2 [Hylaeus anthracinus]|uniref:cysteine-rich motor neuron 1 protein isoform X2 n=1 Tax=Hylaeus anthracinus TaxID=313031 RepID=UPI0023B8E753|nr:cysteine-rich motor neuron 1 protein isoform X2 [Hylaeus anthracinus]
MRASLLLLGGIVVLSIAVARALSCVCSPLECDILTDEDCPGGLTWDPCKCCKVCARVEGEPCGGLFGFSGSCADGLQCVIKNLLPNTREVDEGVCTKIPGRWRRHCPHGPAMSEPGCNLVSEAITEENGNTLSTGKCVCGPSVLWCPDEPQPYVYATRHECKLNLAAKTGYDDLFSSGDTTADDAEGYVSGAECPEDSVRGENGGCKCATVCPPSECPEGQRPVQVKAADPQTPGSCCARYDCIPSESVSWVTVATEDTKSTKYCIYEDKAKNLGERWQQSDCLSCVCEEDGVSCQEPMCKNCENAIPPNPGECCPHCPIPTNATLTEPEPPCRNSLEDCDLTCDHGYVNDENDCPLCSCIVPKEDGGSSGAQPPVEPDKVCPELPHCGLNCDLVKDEGGCSVCACQTPQTFDEPTNDSVLIDETGKKICPEVKCDLHCERGLVMDENDCTFCKCRASDSNCPPLEGCRKRCNFGYKTNKRGCPICRCRASCSDHLNETHPEGSTWHPNACTTCICEAGGRLGCRETICSVACSNPLPPKPGTCCPVCPITHLKQNETSSHQGSRSWGTVPITVIVILSVFCLVLIVDKVRSRFRGRLSPSEASFSSYPPQYYKYVPAYDTPMHRNEKIAPV